MAAETVGRPGLTSASSQPQAFTKISSTPQTQVSTTPEMPVVTTTISDKSGPDDTTILFDSPVFTLYIGPEKRPFYVHQCILAESPVLSRMCEPGFLESKTKEIIFPEDSVDVMDCILQCLYKERLRNLYLSPSPVTLVPRIADLYITADKYQLTFLQSHILGLFTPPTGPDGKLINGIPFLKACNQVYENVTPSEKVFRDYFTSIAPRVIKALTEIEMKDLGVLLGSGGTFAQDVFAAQCTAFGQLIGELKRKASPDPPSISNNNTPRLPTVKKRKVVGKVPRTSTTQS